MVCPSAMFLLAVLFLLLSEGWAFCDQSSVDVGFLYRCQLDWDHFFDDSTPPPGVQVRYAASLDGAAGLPRWLNLLQTGDTSAFIYGTPEQEDLKGSITLHASLTRLDTFEERTREISFTIQQPQGKILQRFEFYVTNYTMEDFLGSDVITRFQQTLFSLYEQDAAAVTKVVNPSERGLLVPPPPDKHGVIVQTTPGLNVAVPMSDETNSIQDECDPDDNFNAPPINFEIFERDGFEISWCHYLVYPVSFDGSQQQASRPVSTVESNQATDRDPPSPHGSYISLVVVMVLGFVVIVMAVSGLAMVFFGRRRSSVSLRKRQRRETMKHHVREDTRGPSTAQKHLRDLARSPSAGATKRDGEIEQLQRAEVGGVGEEGGLLEFQDVVDYGNSGENGSAGMEDQTPPPEYLYDDELLSKPLYGPGRRSRLITL